MTVIKGVHHQIIEIRQTDDPYFERALLFVRAAYVDTSADVLQGEGRRFLKDTGSYTGLRQTRAFCWFKRCALLLAGVFTGVLLGILLAPMG